MISVAFCVFEVGRAEPCWPVCCAEDLFGCERKERFHFMTSHMQTITSKTLTSDGLFPLPDSDSDSDSDYKPYGYIVLCRTCFY